jgi:hypothetical protein
MRTIRLIIVDIKKISTLNMINRLSIQRRER